MEMKSINFINAYLHRYTGKFTRLTMKDFVPNLDAAAKNEQETESPLGVVQPFTPLIHSIMIGAHKLV